MTDTPETIWASPETNGPCAGWDFEGSWHVDQTCGEVKYTRSDIAPKVRAILEEHAAYYRMCEADAENPSQRGIADFQARAIEGVLSALETQGEG